MCTLVHIPPIEVITMDPSFRNMIFIASLDGGRLYPLWHIPAEAPDFKVLKRVHNILALERKTYIRSFDDNNYTKKYDLETRKWKLINK